MPRIRPLPALRRTTITLGSSVMVARARLGLPPGDGGRWDPNDHGWDPLPPPVCSAACTPRQRDLREMHKFLEFEATSRVTLPPRMPRRDSAGGATCVIFAGLWRRFAPDVSAAWSGW